MGDDRPDDNPFLREAEQYDSKQEFLNGAFESLSDYPEGIEVYPEWTDEFPEEAPDIEHAEQVADDTIAYVYRGYPVRIRRVNSTTFRSTIDTGDDYDYRDVEYLQSMHQIPAPSRISGCYSGNVVIETTQFAQHHATRAVAYFVDEELEVAEGQDQIGEALDSFDD